MIGMTRKGWETRDISQSTIEETRRHFARNHLECVIGATRGEFRVNDLDRYVRDELSGLVAAMRGEADYSLSFAQMAVYLQTGKCHAILP